MGRVGGVRGAVAGSGGFDRGARVRTGRGPFGPTALSEVGGGACRWGGVRLGVVGRL